MQGLYCLRVLSLQDCRTNSAACCESPRSLSNLLIPGIPIELKWDKMGEPDLAHLVESTNASTLVTGLAPVLAFS